MHKHEAFLLTLDEEALLQIMFEAEALGPRHVAALKEQFMRLDINVT